MCVFDGRDDLLIINRLLIAVCECCCVNSCSAPFAALNEASGTTVSYMAEAKVMAPISCCCVIVGIQKDVPKTSLPFDFVKRVR